MDVSLVHRNANEDHKAKQLRDNKPKVKTHTRMMCIDFLGSMLTSSKLTSKLNKLGLGVHVSLASCIIAHGWEY